MRRAQLLNCSSLSSVTDDEYIDTDSNNNSYRTELTVFNSDANNNTNSNTHSDANSNTYSNTDSTAELENTYKASAQV